MALGFQDSSVVSDMHAAGMCDCQSATWALLHRDNAGCLVLSMSDSPAPREFLFWAGLVLKTAELNQNKRTGESARQCIVFDAAELDG